MLVKSLVLILHEHSGPCYVSECDKQFWFNCQPAAQVSSGQSLSGRTVHGLIDLISAVIGTHAEHTELALHENKYQTCHHVGQCINHPTPA